MSQILIGIDPGVKTGFSLSEDQKLNIVKSCRIDEALSEVLTDYLLCQAQGKTLKIYIEDARKRKYYGKNSHAKLQGAGSIKRDCKIWEDFLTAENIPFTLVDPKDQKGLTKWTAQQFKNTTGWQGRTNEHSRDAALLIWGK